MTVFNTNFLFLRAPDGGVEDLQAMRQAGFSGVFCNIGDHAPERWGTVRQRAQQQGMFCGPWARTGQGPGTFNPDRVDLLVATADTWASPLIINSEAELQGTGAAATTLIAAKVGRRDAAISMEPWLFADVDWHPVAHLPMLLQINPAENEVSKHPADCKWHAHERGCRCVYFTFGTAPPQAPSWYTLQAPYSLYTGDNATPFSAWSPTSAGFQACVQSPPPSPELPVLTPMQAPYTGPYYGPSDPRGPDKGKTAEALKRAVSRLGYLPWTDFDQHYNKNLEDAMKKFQQRAGLSASGQYGKGSWDKLRAAVVPKEMPNGGEYALDRYARTLLQAEAGEQADSTDEERVQAAIAEFWRIAIVHSSVWHYSQARPGDVSVDPAGGGPSDCSLMVIQAHHYAKRKTGLNVPDPAKQNWTGYGNTDWYEDDWPKVGAPFRVGDLAHFHSERHVIECISPGDAYTAQWGSNGSERDPILVRSLASYYRFPREYLYTVRPDLLA